MYILNLKTKQVKIGYDKDFYESGNTYLYLTNPSELGLLQTTLSIDEETFQDCQIYDNNAKFDLFDNYDYISLNTCEIKNKKAHVYEVNLYLSDYYVLVVVDKSHFIYEYVKNMIIKNLIFEDNPTVTMFKINYFIIREIIKNTFETLEKIEDEILRIEDCLMENKYEAQIEDINYIRGITRVMVKNTRPLLYLGDRILKEDIRYLKYSEVRKYNFINLQYHDFGIDKLYNFALSTRELADKLLDIHSSKIAEKTNSLISKLTVLTAISAPLTIITGIYGMNFDYMPELKWINGYPFILGVMLLIILVGIIIFKIKKLL